MQAPEETPSVSDSFCGLCQVSLDAVNRAAHLAGKQHVKVMSQLNRQSGTVNIVPQTPMWTCEVCRLTMQLNQQPVHEAGKAHMKKAAVRAHSQRSTASSVAPTASVSSIPDLTMAAGLFQVSCFKFHGR